jgi:hypothetical protein
MSEANSFIACQSGGYYADACRKKDYIKSGQAFVIDWKSFKKFMDTGVVTMPVFITDSYGAAITAAKELNESATQIELTEAYGKGK